MWWLVTPDGNAFFSAGVNVVGPKGDYAPALDRRPYQENVLARHGSEAAWRDSTVERFGNLGINTIGAWSETELFAEYVPYTVILGFNDVAPEVPGAPAGITGKLIRDYFAGEFEEGARVHAENARVCADDPWCIGVFSDNELGWGIGFAQTIPYVDAYAMLSPNAPGKLVLQDFFEERYASDIGAFNQVWGQGVTEFDDIQMLEGFGDIEPLDLERAQLDRQDFRGLVALRYFEVVHDALRRVSPDMLILGSRFMVYTTSAAVAAAAGAYVDVVSINSYDILPEWFDTGREVGAREGFITAERLFDDLDEIHRVSGKPILVSEFGYRAGDVGLRNSYPPVFPILPTQDDRASAYESYMQRILTRPHVVGAHWFQHMDQPTEGRFDGEDNNWGLVNIEDDLYPELAAAIERVTGGLYERRNRQ